MKCFIAGLASSLFTVAVVVIPATASPPPDPRVILVELFTSEGCSSCPPADALLRQIDGSQTSAGQLIVGISEHVTYWNSLGWSDPFSSPVYTERQNAYGTRFALDSVYTPQMVVNGTHQFVGSDRARLQQALRKEQEQLPAVSLHIVSANVSSNLLTVKFSATGNSSILATDIFAIITDDLDRSVVVHGENSGRTLSHVAVARSLVRVGKLQFASDQTIRLPFSDSFRSASGHHLILFAQASGVGRILGVDSKPL